jgi:uncharacterized membrane protein YsdA (DUF1294 family)
MGLALALWAVLRWRAHLDVLPSWLLAITVIALLAYGYDKTTAILKWTRVPEAVLLMLTLAGGTVGALIGMLLFRHKTSKRGFRLRFGLVAAIQLALIAAYCILIRR